MDVLVRLAIVAAILVAAALIGRWWQRRDGVVRRGQGGFDRRQLSAVGLDPGDTEALGLLLGSPTCAPCVTVERILGEVAVERPGFQWVKVDAADHLEIAEHHHVMRVPTLFVLDRDGRILARTSGVPGKADVLAVIDRQGDHSLA